jgi:NTE family protein
VLSGGGAKGAAEVGALKYIEEMGIPIDFVCGTSIGGLVGGFYALGYRAADLEELFQSQDWSVMLTDRVAPEYIPYQTKMNRATYLLSFPFHYPKGEGEKVILALWDDGTFSYSLYAEPGVSEDSVVKMIGNIMK